jgi:hypothetical protein
MLTVFKNKLFLRLYRCFIFAVFLLSVFQYSASACICGSAEFAPACQRISTSEVVFIGENLEFTPGKWYRFRIQQIYKGLNSDTREVFINYGAGTSCATEYAIGKTYIIFASMVNQSPLTVASWACFGSRRADLNAADVDFLENYRQGKTTTSIYGKVLQWVNDTGRPKDTEIAPLANAVVTLKNAEQQYTYTTQADGAFHFNDIPEGKFFLSAKLDLYTADPSSYEVNVVKGACNESFIQLKALSSIAGTLLYAEGKPAAGMRVELLRRNQQEKWYATYKMWTQTDKQGNFKFNDIESGDYLLGYEIWRQSPSDYTPYPTRYYPGVTQLSEATPITLLPQQKLKGLQLTLSKPQIERRITLKVVMPDGKPPGENLLQIFNQVGLIKNLEGTGHGGILVFKGYQEREYQFRARYWIDNLRDKRISHYEKRLAKSDIVKLAPGKDDAEVVIVLSHQLKREDEN